MRLATIQLQNEDGSLCRWITPGEAQRMESRGEIVRVTPRRAPQTKYRKVSFAAASLSRITPAQLKRADLNALIGLSLTDEVRLERLKGHGLVPMTAWISESGYIRCA